jgi:hypothetical protein
MYTVAEYRGKDCGNEGEMSLCVLNRMMKLFLEIHITPETWQTLKFVLRLCRLMGSNPSFSHGVLKEQFVIPSLPQSKPDRTHFRLLKNNVTHPQ